MFGLFIAISLSALGPDDACAGEKDPIRVTVVVVLASEKEGKVDSRLKELAAEVRKKDKDLKSFKIAESMAKSIPIGDSATFELIDKQELKVTVERPRDKNDQVGLTIEPPKLGRVTYKCVCSKFFPVVTPHQTKGGERLIIVVMAKPCTLHKKK
jgi:hypothetical protein